MMETYCIDIGHAKCYLVKVNDSYVAIDAGWPGHINEYMKGLKGHNIRPEQIKYLLVTHFHPDHAGLVENLKQFGATFIVFAHQIPYIAVMEKMLRNDRSYLPIKMDTNVVMEIEKSAAFFAANAIPVRAIKTPGHSGDSVSLVFDDGCAFTGDLYSPDLIMEDDEKSRQSWCELEKGGALRIYPAHGNVYIVGKK